MFLLTRTDHALAGSAVEQPDGAWVVSTPSCPTYRWGNHLWLPEPPAPAELAAWVERARAALPGVEGVCLRWDGPAPDTALLAAASALGLRADGGLEMAASAIEGEVTDAAEPLDFAVHGPAIEALNIACDPQEGAGDAGYDGFKRDLRASWRTWPTGRWWGRWVDGELVAQCGLVDTPVGGRFQSVETHPAHRRRGFCGALVRQVARDALARGATEVLLGADPEGNARRLYRRLGFDERGWQQALVDLPAGEGSE